MKLGSLVTTLVLCMHIAGAEAFFFGSPCDIPVIGWILAIFGLCRDTITPPPAPPTLYPLTSAPTGQPKSQNAIQITAPLPDFTTDQRAISVTGFTSPDGTAQFVKVNGADAVVSPSGEFSIETFLLSEGLNLISVLAFDASEVLLASAQVSGSYSRPSEGAVQVTPATEASVENDDSSSVLFGAGISVPAGAAKRNFTANIVYDPEHVPILPFGIAAVGPPVTFAPEAEEFAGTDPVTLLIPFDVDVLTDGTSSEDIEVYGVSDAGWVVVPSSLVGTNQLQVSVDDLTLGPFMAVAEKVLKEGDVLIDTVPAHATVYIDGEKVPLRTPIILEGVTLGSRVAKLYLPGYNEAFVDFISAATGARIQVDLGRPVDPVPEVEIDAGLDGFVTENSFIEITATVSYDGAPLTSGLAIVAVNGVDGIQNVNPDGTISGFVSLAPGDNVIQVRANGPNGSTGVSSDVTITRTGSVRARGLESTSVRRGGQRKLVSGNNDIVVTLSWNTDQTDIDMHIFDPNNNHAWFGNQGGIPGGKSGHPPKLFY